MLQQSSASQHVLSPCSARLAVPKTLQPSRTRQRNIFGDNLTGAGVGVGTQAEPLVGSVRDDRLHAGFHGSHGTEPQRGSPAHEQIVREH